MQADPDEYLIQYNTRRPHQGLGMDGRTPYQVFQDGLQIEIAAEVVTAAPDEAA